MVARIVTRFPVLLLALSIVVLTGCSKESPVEQLPAGQELLSRSADAMSKVKTVALDVQVDPGLTTLPVRSANGRLTATGEASGAAVLSLFGSPVEFQFVVKQGQLYLKGATGNYRQLPLAQAAGIYDPTALLRPDTGVSALLRTATGGVTEAEEDLNGVSTYRVRANLDQQALNSVVPGINGATGGRVWLDKSTSRLVKAQVDVPTGTPNVPPAPVTVTMSDFDAPVTVTAPTSS